MKTFKLHWQLFWKFRKYPLMKSLAYRGDFIFWAVVSLLWTFFNYFFFSLILGVTGEIAGWDFYQMYVLLSVFTMLDAFTWSFFFHNARLYTQAIFSGELDQVLLKPIDTQFLLSTKDNSYTNTPRFFVGLVILIWALGKTGAQLTLASVVSFIFLFCMALFFIQTWWFIISTFAFWVERLNNIHEIMPALRRVYQVPRSVFTGISSFIFSVVFPFALVSSLPSEIILGHNNWEWGLYFTAVTLVLFVISRWFLNVSIKKYASVGS